MVEKPGCSDAAEGTMFHIFSSPPSGHTPVNCRWTYIEVVMRGSIWLGETVYVVNATSFFHKSAIPPLRLTLGNVVMESNYNSRWIGSISLILNFVSVRNKILGPFFLTRLASTWIARQFPSPQQFQLIAIIVLSGAGAQPPSLMQLENQLPH